MAKRSHRATRVCLNEDCTEIDLEKIGRRWSVVSIAFGLGTIFLYRAYHLLRSIGDLCDCIVVKELCLGHWDENS